MAYFVTGATGFIGSYLVANLVERSGPIYVLVRQQSLDRLAELREAWGVDDKRIIAIVGDLAKPKLGVSAADLRKLKGKVDHFFHLAAIYDLQASADDQQAANVDGTRHAVEFATAIAAGCFHHVSSIAAAGLYEGVFREDMFEEAEELDHPYFRTKHDAERVVRRECKRPFRIYRPGFVVGDSKTGQIDKIDGPYYFFKSIQKMREILPPWMPTIGIEGGRINIVPVDFVADALDYLAHQKGLDGRCFHLTDPSPASSRRSAEHFRQGCARAADDDADQRKAVRIHSRAAAVRAGLARAGQARDEGGAERSRHSARRIPVRQLADALRQSRGGQGAEGIGHRRSRSRIVRGEALGLLGAQPRSGPVHRPQPRRPRAGQGRRSSPAHRRASAAPRR